MESLVYFRLKLGSIKLISAIHDHKHCYSSLNSDMGLFFFFGTEPSGFGVFDIGQFMVHVYKHTNSAVCVI